MLPPDRTIVPDVLAAPQDLVTVRTHTTVEQAAQMMAERRIGAVLVVGEDGKLAGIFTERDALVRVVAWQRSPAATLVAEVMTPGPDTIQTDTSVQIALDQMAERGYRHLPVLHGDTIYGIISIRDLYRSMKAQMEEDILMLAEMLIQG